MLEKFYSVVVELENGNRKTLAVKATGSGQAFSQAKAAPEVRRVGKVTEIDASDFDHLSKGGTLTQKPATAKRDSHRESSRNSDSQPKSEKPTRVQSSSDSAPAAPSARYANTGPRVVSHVRTRTGEQPFKHLQAPPERPKPPEPQAKPVKTKAEKPEKPAKTPKPKAAKSPARKPASKGDENTRIIKSRRQDGPAYLVQQGTWKEVGGKRVFTVESEKGFSTREEAEATLS